MCEFRSDLSVRERVFFDEDFYKKLSSDIINKVDIHRDKYSEYCRLYCEGSEDIKEEYYKNAMDNMFVPRVSTVLTDGRKCGKLSSEEIFDGVIYYIKQSTGVPIYSEDYYSGKLGRRSFYFHEDDRLIVVQYSSAKTKFMSFVFDGIYEMCYQDNRISSFVYYNDRNIRWYEMYTYTNDHLTGCDRFIDFNIGEPVSYITDKVSQDGIFYGDKNPVTVQSFKYIYEKDVIVETECTTTNLEEVTIIKRKVKSNEYKKLRKQRFL